MVERPYLTDRGRTRRRRVALDLGVVRERLRAAEGADHARWDQIRAVLQEAVGEDTFEMWLAPLELIAVDIEGTLVVSAPPELVSWVAPRFGRILDNAADRAGCRLRVADELERLAADALRWRAVATPADLPARRSVERSSDFRPDVSPGESGDTSADGSAYPSSYSDVYTQTREVS